MQNLSRANYIATEIVNVLQSLSVVRRKASIDIEYNCYYLFFFFFKNNDSNLVSKTYAHV